MSRWAPLWAAVASFLVVAAVVATTLAVRDDDGPTDRAEAAPATGLRVDAQVVQLRRDETLGRVEIALTNRGSRPITVLRLRLRAAGFTGSGWVPKGSPIPPGQLVDLPTGYGRPICGAGDTDGVPHLRLDLVARDDQGTADLTVTPTGSRTLLGRIRSSLCAEDRMLQEVALSFGPQWRTESTPSGVRLHTTLVARLAPTAPPRDITQVAGTVIFNLAPENPSPVLARLDQAHPSASVPVVLSQATCTGHAKGETKQPYRFLVWVGDPGTGGLGVELPVSSADKARLRVLCAF